jgi:hypothetical protein
LNTIAFGKRTPSPDVADQGTNPATSGKEIARAGTTITDHPSLENLRKQAKSLRKAVAAREPQALGLVREYHPHPDEARYKLALNDAQLVIARMYGFPSWSKLKQLLDVIGRLTWRPPDGAAMDDSVPELIVRQMPPTPSTRPTACAKLLTGGNPRSTSRHVLGAYSQRSVTAGSARIARRAGTQLASRADDKSAHAMASIVKGSNERGRTSPDGGICGRV